MNIVEWRDRVVHDLNEGIRRAKPTGDTREPTAIGSFSVELLQSLIDSAPTLEGLR